MDRLIEGYRRFRDTVWRAERARYEELARRGQSPETLVVACSDSRVDPQTVFGAGPGELFIVRNVAGLVPPYQPDAAYHGASAALEFGVRVLKVRRIVVLGHALCGGVQAMVRGMPAEAQDFVAHWMEIASPVLQGVPDRGDALEHYEHEVVRLSLANLATFPWIQDAVSSSKLSLHGCSFDIRSGLLSILDGETFVSVP